MTRLTLLIAVALLAWLLVRWFIRTQPKHVIASAKRAGLALALLGLVFLVVTGRLNILLAAGAAALPFLKRGFMLLRYLPMVSNLLGGVSRQANAQSSGYDSTYGSTMETRFLRVSLDVSTGNLDGEVLEGAFEGQFLSKMTLDDLLMLFTTCHTQDPRSAALLSAYLDRHHSGWREKTNNDGNYQQGNQQRNQQQNSQQQGHSSGMTDLEAREILGIDTDANEAAIFQAHRRLIHKLHPDRGGSTYLAAIINQAKDYLLNH